MIRTWKCQRVKGGVKCGHINPSRRQYCRICMKPRPARKRPAHLKALDASYEEYVAINGSEACGICGAVQKEGGRRLHRDHDHLTGMARGLLCMRDNRALPSWVTPEWLRAAAAYLERAAERGSHDGA